MLVSIVRGASGLMGLADIAGAVSTIDGLPRVDWALVWEVVARDVPEDR